jgi:3-oxoacyl-[acyl-carrier-protein] synthase II
LLESEEGIVKRSGTKLAEVLSFRVAQEGAGHLLNGNGVVLAATAIGALDECAMRPQDIDLVIGVGQGTQVFLDNERNAVNTIFAGTPPALTSAAMHLGYSPTAIFPQMINLGTAILCGAAWCEADRSGAVWTPGALKNASGIARILVLFTSATFEQCAVVLGKVQA